jgi:hypothetical protein
MEQSLVPFLPRFGDPLASPAQYLVRIHQMNSFFFILEYIHKGSQFSQKPRVSAFLSPQNKNLHCRICSLLLLAASLPTMTPPLDRHLSCHPPRPATSGPNVAKLAVATAGQLNSLAKTMAPDPFRVQRALQLLHRNTPPSVRTTLRFDGAVAKQFYFLVNDVVRVITCPTQATNKANMAICLANLCDQQEDYRPVCFSPEAFGSYFITFVPIETVLKYGLPTSTSNPVLLLPPGGRPIRRRTAKLDPDS